MERVQEVITYFEKAEEREQGYIVEITKLRMENKKLKEELEKRGIVWEQR